MIVQRTVLATARRVAPATIASASRGFTSSLIRNKETTTPRGPRPSPGSFVGRQKMKTLEEINTSDDLLPPGSQPGTVPTDLEQATGLERLELLGKNVGVDVFDMKPLDSSRLGTLEDPIVVKSAGDERYCGCTGFPADSHITIWLTLSKTRPIERCPECGNVLKMEYVGPEEDPHAHDHDHGHGHDHHHAYEEPKTMADFIPEEYRYQ